MIRTNHRLPILYIQSNQAIANEEREVEKILYRLTKIVGVDDETEYIDCSDLAQLF
jgi:hypothetical protein